MYHTRTECLFRLLDFAVEKGLVAPIDRSYTLNEPVSVYAALCHLSESRFHHLFAQHMKCTPIEYRNTLRLSNAENLLRCTDMQIQEIASAVGYDDPFYFCRIFSEAYGISPQKYRKHVQGQIN